jgi:hypothetical protein
MSPTKNKPSWKWIIVVLLSLAVGGGLGYWQGQRVTRQELLSENDSARSNSGQATSAFPTTPPNASPEMKEFLKNQATLAQKMQEARGPGANGTLTPQAFALFRQQNADLLKRQSQLAQIIAQQQQAGGTLATPPPVQIPVGASPQMQTYLTARDKLMRDQIDFMNQHKNDDLATRQAAMEQWRKQNASRIQQLQQLAQLLNPVQAAATR